MTGAKRSASRFDCKSSRPELFPERFFGPRLLLTTQRGLTAASRSRRRSYSARPTSAPPDEQHGQHQPANGGRVLLPVRCPVWVLVFGVGHFPCRISRDVGPSATGCGPASTARLAGMVRISPKEQASKSTERLVSKSISSPSAGGRPVHLVRRRQNKRLCSACTCRGRWRTYVSAMRASSRTQRWGGSLAVRRQDTLGPLWSCAGEKSTLPWLSNAERERHEHVA